ncbi:hypothetical protein VCHA53O466_50430 [Vibrio chagasii]|nr:hypothetical protein VCHA53O466_50430 [Vibrio chagasii]
MSANIECVLVTDQCEQDWISELNLDLEMHPVVGLNGGDQLTLQLRIYSVSVRLTPASREHVLEAIHAVQSQSVDCEYNLTRFIVDDDSDELTGVYEYQQHGAKK